MYSVINVQVIEQKYKPPIMSFLSVYDTCMSILIVIYSLVFVYMLHTKKL